jgi:hypothetical protein
MQMENKSQRRQDYLTNSQKGGKCPETSGKLSKQKFHGLQRQSV